MSTTFRHVQLEAFGKAPSVDNLVCAHESPRHADRPRKRIAAAAAVILTAAGLTGFAAAGPVSAADSLAVQPTCGLNFNGVLYCSQTFSSSGSVSTKSLHWLTDSEISVDANGASGGNAADGTLGGLGSAASGGATPRSLVSGVTIKIGGSGGDSAGWGGGAGGAGGGPGGSGSGGEGGDGSDADGVAVQDGGGGGGGGGATGVYIGTDTAPADTPENLVALAGGGGGAGDLKGYGGWNRTRMDEPGEMGNGAGAINKDGVVCQGGAAGSESAAGIGTCRGGDGVGRTNTTSSGAGGAGVSASGSRNYGVLFSGLGTFDGGGGGGGGWTGGAGGGTTYVANGNIVNNAAGGGAGGSYPELDQRTENPASATLTWRLDPKTTTQVVTSAPTVAPGESVTVTATTRAFFDVSNFVGDVQFLVDGVPHGGLVLAGTRTETVNGIPTYQVMTSGSATKTLSGLAPGTHTVSARSVPGSGLQPSTSQPVTITVAKQTPAVAVTSSATTVSWPTKPTLTATLPADATGTVQFYNSSTGTLGSAAIVNGTAAVTASWLNGGSNTISASYSGDSKYTAATGSTTITVQKWVPSAPTDLTAKGGDGQATLSWVPPLTTGGSLVKQYKANITNAATGKLAATCGVAATGNNPAPTSCTVTGLTNGTIYYVTVNAQNSTGPSPDSAQAKMTPTK